MWVNHLVYTYDNGWNYEIYVKNENTLDYRIHSGLVGNRWVKRSAGVYRSCWGKHLQNLLDRTYRYPDVSLIANLGDKLFHGTIFFPRWVMNNPEKTVCFQNDHIPEMNAYRDAGPAYPTEVIDEFATITFVRDCGPNDDSVIACAASELPENFPANLN
ncbi:ferulic acid decarboxylase [Enterobacter cancerogenus]|uniref:Ferulic acid decarboxylase n=1 Tax=Enterobacter cancerogenus TaxID=69218 RepID=A0A484YUI7_9ENTR|nr:ferulic acid decarboxylase [Enterobacter cancerogenus]